MENFHGLQQIPLFVLLLKMHEVPKRREQIISGLCCFKFLLYFLNKFLHHRNGNNPSIVTSLTKSIYV